MFVFYEDLDVLLIWIFDICLAIEFDVRYEFRLVIFDMVHDMIFELLALWVFEFDFSIWFLRYGFFIFDVVFDC